MGSWLRRTSCRHTLVTVWSSARPRCRRHESAILRHHRHMDPSLHVVRLDLWRADAVVLFDWLKPVDFDAVPITHPAGKQALTDLLTRLEHETDIPGVTQEQIDVAREEVARDMGW